jgi:hypothetical protein
MTSACHIVRGDPRQNNELHNLRDQPAQKEPVTKLKAGLCLLKKK